MADQDIVDVNAGDRDGASIEVGRLRFQFLPDEADRAGYTCLPLARMVEMRADRQIVLDDDHIPPILASFITELTGLLHHRGEALAARVSQSGTRGVAEISDYLLLQVINGYEPYFEHLGSAASVHPEALFGTLVRIAGELATYARPEKRPPPAGVYRHEDLAATFRPVVQSVRQSLRAVLEQTAIAIPLRQHKYGVPSADEGEDAEAAPAAAGENTNPTCFLIVKASNSALPAPAPLVCCVMFSLFSSEKLHSSVSAMPLGTILDSPAIEMPVIEGLLKFMTASNAILVFSYKRKQFFSEEKAAPARREPKDFYVASRVYPDRTAKRR